MDEHGNPMSYEQLKERYDRIAALPENQFVLDLKSSDEESEEETLGACGGKNESSSSEDEDDYQPLEHPNDEEIRRLKIQLAEVDAAQRAYREDQHARWQSMKAEHDAEREQIDKDFMDEMLEIRKEYEEEEKKLREGLILDLENKKKQYQWEYENMRIDSDYEQPGPSFKRQLRPRNTQGKVDTTTPKPSETFHETSVPTQCSSKGSKNKVIKNIPKKRVSSAQSSVSTELPGSSTPEKVFRPRGRQNSECGSATVKNHLRKPGYTCMLRAAEIEEDVTLLQNFGKRLTTDPTRPEESSCSSSESEESVEDDSNVNTVPTHVDAKIESGKLFFDKRWFNRGQSVLAGGKGGHKASGIITEIKEDFIIVRKMNSHLKMDVTLESLRNGEMVISRLA